MRRLILEEPVTPYAIWSRRVGLFGCAVALIGLALTRSGQGAVTGGLAVLGAGFTLALVAAGLCVAAFVMIWREGHRGLGLTVASLGLIVLTLSFPGWLMVKAISLPKIRDISTDLERPPAFSRSSQALQARQGFVPAEVGAEVRELQAQAYPRVAPLYMDLSPEEVFALARKAAEKRGWQIIEAVAPGGRLGLGRIEAIDRTFILRLPEDITIRIRPRADGTRLDVRSASRIGAHDFGSNAKRIERFFEEMNTQSAAK